MSVKLRDLLMEIFDNDVGLLVEATLLVDNKRGADGLTFYLEIVHFPLTSFGFLLGIEGQESILSWLLSNLVDAD